jgi:hypothetical protein
MNSIELVLPRSSHKVCFFGRPLGDDPHGEDFLEHAAMISEVMYRCHEWIGRNVRH